MRQITELLTHPLQTFEEQAPYEAGVWPTFDDWWDLYGKKIDRRKCERKWAKMSQAQKEVAMAHTEAYVAATPDITYRRHPYTYLFNENWNDEQLATVRTRPIGASAIDRARATSASLDDYYARKAAGNEGR